MLPRHLLPQIPKEQYERFREFVIGHGVPMTLRFVPVELLQPIQTEVNRDKIESLKKSPEKLKNPIIVSKGGLVLDGHHRWLAAKELDAKARIPCLVAGCDINELIALGHRFDGSFRKTVKETTNYSSNPESDALLVRKTLHPWTEMLRKLRLRRGEIED